MGSTFTRGWATLNALNRALTAEHAERLPNIEFKFTTEDYGDNDQEALWTYSKRTNAEDRMWLMPDFGYWSWPEVKVGSYREIRRKIADTDHFKFSNKTKKLIWRGAVGTNPEIRGKLMEAADGKPWGDVKALDWKNDEDIQANLLPMESHCEYMFVAHTEGRSFSGRGKYLQNCRSVMIAHKLDWIEAHHGALVATGPDANYVQVEQDWSDLGEKIEHLISHPAEAERIADNSVHTFRNRYLTPAAEACYWRKLINAYASVSFEPSLLASDGSQRAVPFESFTLTRALL
jgi:hypothetical protein